MESMLPAVCSAEQLLCLHDPGFRHELVRGELRRMSPAGFPHGVVSARIAKRLANVADERRLGLVCGAETGFLLAHSPDTVLAPDVAFVTAARVRLADPVRGYYPGPPDLAVEVVSPSDSANAVREKTQAWLDHGTRMVWIADPVAATVTIHRAGTAPIVLSAADELRGDEVVPGFAIRVGELFPQNQVWSV